jgi:hypothetical protein
VFYLNDGWGGGLFYERTTNFEKSVEYDDPLHKIEYKNMQIELDISDRIMTNEEPCITAMTVMFIVVGDYFHIF